MNTTEHQNDALQLFCPNVDCPARGKRGAGNLVSHGKKRERSQCKTCRKTFRARRGTMCVGLRTPEEVIVSVVTLLAYGCPPQASVHALSVDERTVARWHQRAGAHCQRVHEEQVMAGKLDLVHVQADEIRAKGWKMIPWMAMALMVSTRVWVGGTVSLTRDRHLADQLVQMVKACCQPLRAVLVLTDGWSASPNSIRRAFRTKVTQTAGPGRCHLHAWPEILLGTVIKKTAKKHVVEVIRRMAQGNLERANAVLSHTMGGNEVNTACIERFNGTMRERLARLTRRCRHAARRVVSLEAGMWLVGCPYTFCWPHHEVSRRAAQAQGVRGDVPLTPAMASGLTDHVWGLQELLRYRIAPVPWTAPKRRGRPRTQPVPAMTKQARSLLRLRKGVLCPSTI